MEETVETGRKITARPRKSHTFGEGRVCKDTFCKQVLSKYNNQDYCFVHHKYKAPRVRGIEVLDI